MSRTEVTSAQPIRVLVVDDHQLIREGVRSIFAGNPQFTVCGEAVDGKDGLEQFSRLRPDIVLLDVTMPVMGGLEAAAELRRISSETKIVILTMHDNPQVRTEAAKAGADGFVTKSEVTKKLIEILSAVCSSSQVPVANASDGFATPGQTRSLKYPWQQLVFAAFLEVREEFLTAKIEAAERMIHARLAECPDVNETAALRRALDSLQTLRHPKLH